MQNTKNNKNTEKKPGDKDMKEAYELASFLVKDRLKREDTDNITILDELVSDDILIVDGTYDHIHLVLELSGLPYKRVDASYLLSNKLREDQTIFVNCASSFPPESARKLAGFVASGGQLITTDWALKNVLEVGFEGYVRFNRSPTSDEVVRIEVLEKDDPLMRGFLDEEADALWWLEGSSYPIEIINKEKVRVLIQSKELGEKYNEKAVLISFEYGKGIVYHMISHFYLQRTETRNDLQKTKASKYAAAKGASKKVMDAYYEMETNNPDLNYGSVQSAATSSEFVSRSILRQKKKFRQKKKDGEQ